MTGETQETCMGVRATPVHVYAGRGLGATTGAMGWARTDSWKGENERKLDECLAELREAGASVPLASEESCERCGMAECWGHGTWALSLASVSILVWAPMGRALEAGIRELVSWGESGEEDARDNAPWFGRTLGEAQAEVAQCLAWARGEDGGGPVVRIPAVREALARVDGTGEDPADRD